MCCAASCAAPCATCSCSARVIRLMFRIVPALIHEMGLAYPELVRAEALISETLKLEETRFRKTLERGLSLLGEASQSLNSGDQFDGETAFKLYDTYGFPLDLTQDALRQRGITVDTGAFSTAMAAAEGRSAGQLVRVGRCGDGKCLVRRQGQGRLHRVSRL